MFPVALTIDRVRTRAQLTRFIRLPRQLYQGMPGYTPPLDYERRQMLDPRRSAFFTHGEATYWIASRDGRPAGRISAQIDFAADGPDAGRTGLFGCLDAADDSECVAALLRTAESWLHERGRRTVRGPFVLSINSESGLLVDGQLQPPVTLLPWHPPYLDRHVRAAGYDAAQLLYTFACKREDFAFDRRLEQLAQIRSRAAITVHDLHPGIPGEIEIARRIFNDGWQRNWGFTPATPTDVRALAHQFKPFLFPDTAFFIAIGGEPVAFMIGIPNVFEITGDLGPAPSIVGWAKLLFRIYRQRYRCFRIILLGMLSRYQSSALGAAIATVMFDEVRQRLHARHADECVLGWVVDSNHLPLKAVGDLGFRQTQTYSVYERCLVE